MSPMILDVGDASLSYFVAGEGRPVTLLHGFTQSGRSWREVVAKMPAGWKWIVPDLRGHGETQIWRGSACSMDACTQDLVKLWDALDVEKSHLVGYSMGGRLALHVAARRPERVLSVLTTGARAMEPLWDDLAHADFPCTFVAGQLDHGYVASARRLAATVPNGRVEIVPRAGHTVHQERPDAFARILSFHLAAATAV